MFVWKQLGVTLPTVAAKHNAVEKELKALIKQTCISTQKILSKESKEREAFFRYANARIEMNTDVTSITDIINIIRHDLEMEKKAQGTYITSMDLQKMAKLFVENFMNGLHEYPSLESFFVGMLNYCFVSSNLFVSLFSLLCNSIFRYVNFLKLKIV